MLKLSVSWFTKWRQSKADKIEEDLVSSCMQVLVRRALQGVYSVHVSSCWAWVQCGTEEGKQLHLREGFLEEVMLKLVL